MRFSAILLLSGVGSRFESPTPKQFHRLSGKKIFLHTLETFLQEDFDKILLVCHKDWIFEAKLELPDDTRIEIIQGGKTRQESSYLGIRHLDSDYVMIHDAVRPFVSSKILRENWEKALLHQAVDTCIASTDTIVHSKDQKLISDIPNRSHFLRGQTPQTFSLPLIRKAHENALQKNLNDISDDCRLVLELGCPVHLVQGSETNIKITTELDLFLAEQLLRTRTIKPSFSHPVSGKTFIIVGGSGGIGCQISNLLKVKNANVINVSRTSSEYPLDLRKSEDVEKTFTKIYQEHGEVDGIINSAGRMHVKPLYMLSLKEISELLEVNLTGVISTCKFCRIRKGGHIINIASSSFSRGRKNYGIYSCSKAAVVNFTQSLAEEMPDLRVNVLIPPRCRTKMRLDHFEDSPNTLLDPKEVAKSALTILEDGETTGSIIEVKKLVPQYK